MTVNVGEKLTIKGAKIANEEGGIDKGNLNVTAGELEYSDLHDNDSARSSNIGISGGYQLAGASWGDASANVSEGKSPFAERGKEGGDGKQADHTRDAKAELPGLLIAYSDSEKEGTTRATIGQGTITVGGVEDDSGINRDITKAQEVTKDESTGAEIDVPLELIVDPKGYAQKVKDAPAKHYEAAKNIINAAVNTVKELGLTEANSPQVATIPADKLPNDWKSRLSPEARAQLENSPVMDDSGNCLSNCENRQVYLQAVRYETTSGEEKYNLKLINSDGQDIAEIREPSPQILADNFAGDFLDEIFGVPATALNDLTNGWLHGGDIAEGYPPRKSLQIFWGITLIIHQYAVGCAVEVIVLVIFYRPQESNKSDQSQRKGDGD